MWSRGRYVRQYAHRRLAPVEVLALVEHREDLAGRVLELGCGAGRVTGYLVELASEVHALDLSEAMLAEARRRYPGGHFARGDMRDLSAHADASVDAVVAANNLIDVLGDGERQAALREWRRVLRPGGLLLLSSHNRAHLPHLAGPARVRTSDPLRFAYDLAWVPVRVRRHRRLSPLERRTEEYAIVSDGSHNFTLVHYYVAAEEMRRQLVQAGFEVLSVRDLDGRPLGPGEEAPDSSELHYAARRAAA